MPSQPGRVLSAPISFIEPSLNEKTRTARVRVTLENAERRLHDREAAQALVALTGPEALLVPRAAVLQHGGRAVVYVDQGGQGYRAREIRLGRVGDSDAEVLGGLSVGERVVTQAALILDSQAQLAHAAVAVAAAGPVPVLPAKVPAGTPPHSEGAYALLRTLVFAADGAAALGRTTCPATARACPPCARRSPPISRAMPQPPMATWPPSPASCPIHPTSTPPAAPSSPSARPWRTWPAPSRSSSASRSGSTSAR